MSIQYKMIERGSHLGNPEEKEIRFYPQIVRRETIGIEQLASDVAGGRTRNSIEVETTIRLILNQIEEYLLAGNNVCFKGFGTFALTAACHEVTDPSQIRAESISVKRVTFTPSSPLRKRLKAAKFEKAKL